MDHHSGHRDRLRQRFLAEGLEHFTEKQVLELLLFYVIPRQDTEPIAHSLLEHFGSFQGVMEAPMSALAQVPGMGENAAVFVRLLSDFTRYHMLRQRVTPRSYTSVRDIGNHLLPMFIGRRNEVIVVMALDGACKILGCKMLTEGLPNTTQIPLRKIAEYALSVGASSIVLAHNHPSGIALPSQSDVDVTSRIALALHPMSIAVVDHLIFADGDYISLLESGLFKPDQLFTEVPANSAE